MKVNITPDAKAVLLKSTVTGLLLTLPPLQLPRKLYEEVNKVLDAGGGKWNRKQGGHLFPSAERLAELQAQWKAGDEVVHVKKATQAFYTPDDLADELVAMAGLGSGMTILEPSAGEGALIKAALRAGVNKVEAVEIDPVSARKLAAISDDVTVVCADFLALPPKAVYDAVIMNPPFTGNQDIDHVMHALAWLKPGCHLTAITSQSWRTGSTKKQKAFAELMKNGTAKTIPAGAFSESGTKVATVMIKLTAPGKQIADPVKGKAKGKPEVKKADPKGNPPKGTAILIGVDLHPVSVFTKHPVMTWWTDGRTEHANYDELIASLEKRKIPYRITTETKIKNDRHGVGTNVATAAKPAGDE